MELPAPPHLQLRDFLPAGQLADLLAWTLASQGSFAAATVRAGDDQVVNPGRRVALTSGALGPMRSAIGERMLDALPMLMDRIGATGPAPTSLEIELAAHGNGAHYGPHTDLPIGAARKRRAIEDDRVLSAVLYYHAEPKAFSGGELRLFNLGAEPDRGQSGDFVDIQPLQNSLVVFHSWVRHEVRPVKVPSEEFRDYRFAVNIWFRRKLA